MDYIFQDVSPSVEFIFGGWNPCDSFSVTIPKCRIAARETLEIINCIQRYIIKHLLYRFVGFSYYPLSLEWSKKETFLHLDMHVFANLVPAEIKNSLHILRMIHNKNEFLINWFKQSGVPVFYMENTQQKQDNNNNKTIETIDGDCILYIYW